MSPNRMLEPPGPAVLGAVNRFWGSVGMVIRGARVERRWTVAQLAGAAGLSRRTAYLAESGQPTSIEAVARLLGALGLRLDAEVIDPRRRRESTNRSIDPVHSAMAEFEVGHFREFGFQLRVDEPYQHYQFAGRADVVAWDAPGGAFLHIENRTRFPDLGETAGSFNAKRAYLAPDLAERLGLRRWASQTHVVAALWSSEVLHVLRLRRQTFLTLCPDPADVFAQWWVGSPPRSGVRSVLVLVDPLARARQRTFIALDEALGGARPRYRGYADAAEALERRD